MGTMTAATTGTTKGWTAQVALALLLAGFFAMSSLIGARAGVGSDAFEDMCEAIGGDLIEITNDAGEVTDSRCESNGEVAVCYWEYHTCHTSNLSGDVGPTDPKGGLDGIDGLLGDRGVSIEPAPEPESPTDVVSPPVKHKKHKHGQGKGRNRR